MNNHDSHPDVPRRGFFVKAVTGLVGGLVGLIPAALAGGFLLGPILGRNRNQTEEDGLASGDGFVPLPIGPDALPADGTPQEFTVRADRTDAWNFYPNERVGSVWLRKVENQIIAFNTICPHLGCAVEYRQANTDFFCPCHFSAFGLDGERQNAIPPRGMDSLETKVVDGKIWVKYEAFRGGIEEKIPV